MSSGSILAVNFNYRLGSMFERSSLVCGAGADALAKLSCAKLVMRRRTKF